MLLNKKRDCGKQKSVFLQEMHGADNVIFLISIKVEKVYEKSNETNQNAGNCHFYHGVLGFGKPSYGKRITTQNTSYQ